MLSGLMIDTVVFSVREGGGEVDVGGEVRGSCCPRAGSLLRERRLGLGAKEVRVVITGSGVEGLRRVTGVCFIGGGGVVSVGVFRAGGIAGDGRGLVTGRRCGRGGWLCCGG